jgi:hypothetical protein
VVIVEVEEVGWCGIVNAQLYKVTPALYKNEEQEQNVKARVPIVTLSGMEMVDNFD